VELRDLEYFLACCRTGNFTAAAREVHIVQSAMSSAMARLETELGVTLFDRSVTPVTPTEHGFALQLGAQRILDAVNAARDDLATVSGQVRGTVVLGSTLHRGTLDLAAVLVKARDRYPDVVVQLRQSARGSVGNLAAVLDGSMDIALTASPHPHGPPEGITLRPLVTEPMVFVCRRDHPLAGHASVTTSQLAKEQILRFPPGWGIRDIVDLVLGPSSSAAEVYDYQLMAKLVQAEFGTTLMPKSGVEARWGLVGVRVNDARMRWSLSAATSAVRRATAATSALLDCLSQASEAI
jgi:DNA-binding transcriptional LysR family regulator